MIKQLMFYLKNRSIPLKEQELFVALVNDHREYEEKYKIKFDEFLKDMDIKPKYLIEKNHKLKYMIKRLCISPYNPVSSPFDNTHINGMTVLMPKTYEWYKQFFIDDLDRQIWYIYLDVSEFDTIEAAEAAIANDIKDRGNSEFIFRYDHAGKRIAA